MNNSNYRLPIIVAVAGIFIIIVLSVIYVLTDGGKPANDPGNKSISQTPAPAGQDPAYTDPDPALIAGNEDLHHMNAIIKGVDPDNTLIIAQERETTAEYEFTYDGATDIRTAYNRQITATLLKPGDFVSLDYNDENHLRRLTGSKDVEIYKNVLQRTQDDVLRKITVGDRLYRYEDDLLVMNDGYFVGLDTVLDMDVISLYSVGNHLCLINVEHGHGYFKMVNHSYFNGGTLRVGKNMSMEITDDLYLTLEEGEYDIVVEHEDFYGEATIMIDRDMTTVLDMSAYTPQSALKGYCMFEITPESALLYVDGVLTPYGNAVELTQGEHWIQVAAGGYTPYTGFIEIGDSILDLNIMLLPAPSKTPDILYEDTSNENDSSAPVPADTATPGPGSPQSGDIVDSTSDTGEGPGGAADGNRTDDTTEGNGTGEPADSNGTNEAAEGDDSGEPADGNTTGNTTEGTNNPGTGNAVMTIKGSEGAAVFIDDKYKGTIEGGSLSLPKTPGTHSVRLTKEGYITRRYTISVEDDGEDAEYAFPEMVAE